MVLIYNTFTNKKDTVVWIRGIEARIDAGETNVSPPKATSFSDLLVRHSNEVIPSKNGCDPEHRRLYCLFRDPLAATMPSKLTGAKLAESRDQRMNESVQATQYDLILIKR